jgi:hypothetical protein
MSSQPQLSGHILSEGETAAFAKIRDLEHQVGAIRKDVQRALAEIQELRNAVGPFLVAMKKVFSSYSGTEKSPEIAVSAAASSVWDVWKQRLGGKQSEIIEVLQLGPKTATQIKNAIGGRNSTVFAHLKKMSGMGLIVNNGGKYSLKEN